MDKVIVAKFTHEGTVYAGKREVTLYTEDSSGADAQCVSDANRGMTLRIQNEIREAVKVKHGLKAVSAGGEVKDLSDIETY